MPQVHSRPSLLRIGALGIGLALAVGACGAEDVPEPTVAVVETPTPEPVPTVTEETRVFEETPIEDAFLGMHVAGVHEGRFPDAKVPVGSVRLWDSGTSWAQIEESKGRYNWVGLDRALQTAEAAGVDDILMILGPTPTWNAKTTSGVHYPLPGAASVPRDLDAWDRFVRATVDRYAGKIDAYQIWNEASLKMFWRGSGETLADLTKRAYDIIKERDPEALVVGASITVRLPNAFERFFPSYLNALAERDWPLDVITIHSYPTGEQNPQDRAQNLARVRSELVRLNAPALPVWDTELNYGLAGPGPIARTPITGRTATEWTVRTYMDSFKYDIARTYWYIWTQQPYELLGIQMTNDSAAAAGLRTVDDWLTGGIWGGCVQDGPLNSCAVTKNGVRSELVWTDTGEVSITDVRVGAEICDVRNECAPTATSDFLVTTSPVRINPHRD
jgi:hypothetical protein